MKDIAIGVSLLITGFISMVFISFGYESHPDIVQVFKAAISFHKELDYFLSAVFALFLMMMGAVMLMTSVLYRLVRHYFPIF